MHTDKITVTIHNNHCTGLRNEDIRVILDAISELLSSAILRNETTKLDAA